MKQKVYIMVLSGACDGRTPILCVWDGLGADKLMKTLGLSSAAVKKQLDIGNYQEIE